MERSPQRSLVDGLRSGHMCKVKDNYVCFDSMNNVACFLLYFCSEKGLDDPIPTYTCGNTMNQIEAALKTKLSLNNKYLELYSNVLKAPFRFKAVYTGTDTELKLRHEVEYVASLNFDLLLKKFKVEVDDKVKPKHLILVRTPLLS